MEYTHSMPFSVVFFSIHVIVSICSNSNILLWRACLYCNKEKDYSLKKANNIIPVYPCEDIQRQYHTGNIFVSIINWSQKCYLIIKDKRIWKTNKSITESKGGFCGKQKNGIQRILIGFFKSAESKLMC